MNMLAFPRAPVVVEIIYDLVCPWCFIGTRRLLRMMRRRPDIDMAVEWRPFLLNPDMPRSGMSRSAYIQRKFGAEDRARRLFATITEFGRGEGIAFRFDLIRTTPSSVDAHRLVHFAAGFDRGEVVANAIFVAYFCEGQDIGAYDVLLGIGRAAGLPLAETKAFLASDMATDLVHADNLRAHRLGINGAPCFILGRRHAIAGAQEPEVLECLLNVAIFDLSMSESE
ncbi:DsbA family oxidoreductase [Acidisoma cellulosilytica]|uniref:DsbA family oxidoreductase n=1 Tax=Acidisoma cellulosilyticum TaxID=2802395 RepID=A0A963YWW2_9PROT|nr:DsbA family oxidoreductase [Acidisoma cellulosilyticum]MCB8878692.1 DsbA family oxidoreductase [Acidisoma cellulosilyticum]